MRKIDRNAVHSTAKQHHLGFPHECGRQQSNYILLIFHNIFLFFQLLKSFPSFFSIVFFGTMFPFCICRTTAIKIMFFRSIIIIQTVLKINYVCNAIINHLQQILLRILRRVYYIITNIIKTYTTRGGFFYYSAAV